MLFSHVLMACRSLEYFGCIIILTKRAYMSRKTLEIMRYSNLINAVENTHHLQNVKLNVFVNNSLVKNELLNYTCTIL